MQRPWDSTELMNISLLFRHTCVHFRRSSLENLIRPRCRWLSSAEAIHRSLVTDFNRDAVEPLVALVVEHAQVGDRTRRCGLAC